MSDTPSCPDRDSLQRFLLGTIPEGEAERLEQHVALCSPCLETLHGLNVSDSVLEAVRQSSPSTPVDLPNDFIEQLSQRLRRLGLVEIPPPQGPVPAGPARGPLSTTAFSDQKQAGSASALLPDKIGPYRILKRLPSGGMGTVYQAEDLKLKRLVAIKIPRFEGSEEHQAEQAQRFLREARAAACIRHPHVCPIYHCDEHDGKPYVVMHYMEGQSLAERFPARDSCDPHQAVTLIRQVAEALEEIHNKGIIHRDLKPANILLDAKGDAVLADFGLACLTDDREHLTRTGTIAGTPAYMAPEQAAGRRAAIGPRTDLYSLGVVLYRLLTGRLPFEEEDLLALIYAVASQTPPPPSTFRPDLDPALEAILLKAIAHSPEDRYANAAEFRKALEDWTASAARQIVPEKAAPISAVAVGACVLAGLIAAGVLIINDRDGNQVVYVSAIVVATLAVSSLGVVGLITLGTAAVVALRQGRLARWWFLIPEQSGGSAIAGSPPQPGENTDRSAAEWVLQIGGAITIATHRGGPETNVARLADLPQESFILVAVELCGNQQATDAGLVSVHGLKDLRHLALAGTPVSSAGLETIGSLPSLVSLDLNNTQLTDTSLEYLPGLQKLQHLYLVGTQLSDNSLAILADLPGLRQLSLPTQITDVGLLELAGLGGLQLLELSGTAITNIGLKSLQGWRDLQHLGLSDTTVSGDGLQYLQGLASLQVLNLAGTKIADEGGLEHLVGLRSLRWLSLERTQVSDLGLAPLAEAKGLRELNLSWTRITDSGLRHLSRLTSLQQLNLTGAQVSDAGFEHLAGLTGLQVLSLAETRVSGVGLHHLAGLTGLKHLYLQGTPISGFGLENLEALTGLQELHLSNTRLSDAGMEHLRGLLRLQTLTLGNTRVSDKGVEKLKDLKGLENLHLDDTATSDQGLAHLEGLTRLHSLNLTRTWISDADLETIARLARLVWLVLVRTEVSDGGLRHLSGLTRLRELDLGETHITDAGLEHLAGLSDLVFLGLSGTGVSEEGSRRIKAAIPRCNIRR